MKIIFGLFLGIFSFQSWPQTHIAIVKSVTGEASSVIDEKSVILKADDLLEVGALIKTLDQSSVAIVFSDNTRLTAGSATEIKISQFDEKAVNFFELNKGRVRVSLAEENEKKIRLYMKTPSALLGVGNGDFLVSSNQNFTAVVSFEGEAFFHKYTETGSEDFSEFQKEVVKGVELKAGEFSVENIKHLRPTVPAVLSMNQIALLEKNTEMVTDTTPVDSKGKKSVVPTGLSGNLISSNFEILNSELTRFGVKTKDHAKINLVEAKGYIRGEEVRPTNGSFLNLELGEIIHPGRNSLYDINSNTYLSAQENGNVTLDGNFLVKNYNSEIGKVSHKIKKAPTFPSLLDIRFLPTGGVMNVNDPQRAQSDYRGTTIQLRDN